MPVDQQEDRDGITNSISRADIDFFNEMSLALLIVEAEAAFTGFNLGTNYSNRVSPALFQETKGPLKLMLTINIIDILEVNEVNAEVTLDCIITSKWLEPRLHFTEVLTPGRPYPVDQLQGIWKPELLVAGTRDFKITQGTMAINYAVFFSNKMIHHFLGISLTVKCVFDFDRYPLDTQTCNLDFLSPAQLVTDLELRWDSYPAVRFFKRAQNMTIHLPQYEVQIIICNDSFVRPLVSGNVSSVRSWLFFRRHIRSHVLETYIPSGMFVVISWGSFLVKPEIVPGRVVLLVTNLLSLITIFEATRKSVPSSEGIKCLDIWLISCILFVFTATLEYAVILHQARGKFCQERNVHLKPYTEDVPMWRRSLKPQWQNTKAMKKLKVFLQKFSRYRLSKPEESSWSLMDQMSIILFPISFVIFNMCYWFIMLKKTEENVKSYVCTSS